MFLILLYNSFIEVNGKEEQSTREQKVEVYIIIVLLEDDGIEQNVLIFVMC